MALHPNGRCERPSQSRLGDITKSGIKLRFRSKLASPALPYSASLVLLLAKSEENQIVSMNEFGFVNITEFGFDLC